MFYHYRMIFRFERFIHSFIDKKVINFIAWKPVLQEALKGFLKRQDNFTKMHNQYKNGNKFFYLHNLTQCQQPKLKRIKSIKRHRAARQIKNYNKFSVATRDTSNQSGYIYTSLKPQAKKILLDNSIKMQELLYLYQKTDYKLAKFIKEMNSHFLKINYLCINKINICS